MCSVKSVGDSPCKKVLCKSVKSVEDSSLQEGSVCSVNSVGDYLSGCVGGVSKLPYSKKITKP